MNMPQYRFEPFVDPLSSPQRAHAVGQVDLYILVTEETENSGDRRADEIGSIIGIEHRESGWEASFSYR